MVFIVKKKFIILIIVVVVVFSYLAYYINTRNHINYLEDELKSYLINKKHYSENDIKSIQGHRGKMPKYWVDVIFNDEPNIIYKYTDRDVGEWRQIEPSASDLNNGLKYKHIENESN
ncbi:hypothetical protein SAM19_00602 [Brevibacillus laterosporus]|nr:hypothetical protein [Brevibacillus laterosporus]